MFPQISGARSRSREEVRSSHLLEAIKKSKVLSHLNNKGLLRFEDTLKYFENRRLTFDTLFIRNESVLNAILENSLIIGSELSSKLLKILLEKSAIETCHFHVFFNYAAMLFDVERIVMEILLKNVSMTTRQEVLREIELFLNEIKTLKIPKGTISFKTEEPSGVETAKHKHFFDLNSILLNLGVKSAIIRQGIAYHKGLIPEEQYAGCDNEASRTLHRQKMAFHYFMIAAKSGNVLAQTLLGEYYSKNIGIPPEELSKIKEASEKSLYLQHESYRWYHLAAESGKSPAACLNLVNCHSNNINIPKIEQITLDDKKLEKEILESYQKAQAVIWCRRAAASGSKEAQYLAGMYFLKNKNIVPKIIASFKTLKSEFGWLAKKLMSWVGSLSPELNMMMTGFSDLSSGSQNQNSCLYSESPEFWCFAKAAAQGHAAAIYELALIYQKDPKSPSYEGLSFADSRKSEAYRNKKCYELCILAAERGVPEAEEAMGLDYFINDWPNPKLQIEQTKHSSKIIYKIQAFKWLKAAAEQGMVVSADNLGCIYKKYPEYIPETEYQGIKEEHEKKLHREQKAFYWFKFAAQHNHSSGAFHLGMNYLHRVGIPPEEFGFLKSKAQKNAYCNERAFYWLEKAAKQGHKHAQYRFSLCFYENIGLPSADFGLSESDAKTSEQHRLRHALLWAAKSAEAGIINAQYLAGRLCQIIDPNIFKNFFEDIFGLSFNNDSPKEWTYYFFARAAGNGHTAAKLELASIYLNDPMAPSYETKTYKGAISEKENFKDDAERDSYRMKMYSDLCFSAAEEGSPLAQEKIGLACLGDKELPDRAYGWAEDEETRSLIRKKLAFKWLKAAAEQGRVDAAVNLGYLYGLPNHTDYIPASEYKNIKEERERALYRAHKAFYWNKLTAEKGDYVGQFNLGLHYRGTKPIPAEEYSDRKTVAEQRTYRNEQAFYWFKAALKQGYKRASTELISLYEYEPSVISDKEYIDAKSEAERFTYRMKMMHDLGEIAAEICSGEAQLELARLYLRQRSIMGSNVNPILLWEKITEYVKRAADMPWKSDDLTFADLKNSIKLRPLHLALRHRRDDIYKALIEHNISINELDELGHTLFDTTQSLPLEQNVLLTRASIENCLIHYHNSCINLFLKVKAEYLTGLLKSFQSAELNMQVSVDYTVLKSIADDMLQHWTLILYDKNLTHIKKYYCEKLSIASDNELAQERLDESLAMLKIILQNNIYKRIEQNKSLIIKTKKTGAIRIETYPLLRELRPYLHFLLFRTQYLRADQGAEKDIKDLILSYLSVVPRTVKKEKKKHGKEVAALSPSQVNWQSICQSRARMSDIIFNRYQLQESREDTRQEGSEDSNSKKTKQINRKFY